MKIALGLCLVFGVVGITSTHTFAATDVLFLIDSTGSMLGLDSFKMALNRILGAIGADSACSDTIMYGVADYKNYTDGGNFRSTA
jgi:hypothetical protein